MKLAIGIRLQSYGAPGSMGVVTDTLFVNCYWPKLDRPTRIFATESSGIRVMGNPTPRNVWFPDDTEFMSYYPDGIYPAELAVKAAFPFKRLALIDLSPAESQVWLDAYNAAVKDFPPTKTVFTTPRNVNFLRHYEVVSEREHVLPSDVETAPGTFLRAGAVVVKRQLQEFTSMLTPEECCDLCDGKCDEAELRNGKVFIHPTPKRDENDVKCGVLTLDEWKAGR